MAQAAFSNREEAATPPIDRAHLARMTFGEKALEREVLALFERQAALLVARMGEADAATAGTLAHTLKGSAVGVGAGEVAAAAAAVEEMPGREQLAALGHAVERARAAIAAMLAPRAD